jgi:hypothetical protein
MAGSWDRRYCSLEGIYYIGLMDQRDRSTPVRSSTESEVLTWKQDPVLRFWGLIRFGVRLAI